MFSRAIGNIDRPTKHRGFQAPAPPSWEERVRLLLRILVIFSGGSLSGAAATSATWEQDNQFLIDGAFGFMGDGSRVNLAHVIGSSGPVWFLQARFENPVFVATPNVPGVDNRRVPSGAGAFYSGSLGASGADATPHSSGVYLVSSSCGLAMGGTMSEPAGGINLPPQAFADTGGTVLNRPLALDLTKLLLNDVDPEGNPFTIVGVIPTTQLGGTVSLTGAQVIYTPPTDATGTDYFFYTVSDGNGGTTEGSVGIRIRAGSGAQPLKIAVNPDNSRVVTFIGIPSRNYLVQTAGDVASGHWTTVATLSASRNGRFDYEDFENPPVRFYRAVAP